MDPQTNFLPYFGDAAKLVTLPADATIFREGDEGDYTYVVKSGKVRIETRGQELAVIGAGEIFGEMAMIDRVQRRSRASTRSNRPNLSVAPKPPERRETHPSPPSRHADFV